MRRLYRSPKARLDLIELWQYIAAENETAADRFLDRIETVLITIAENPLIGRARPELADGIRSFPIGNYVVFYRPSSDAIDLVRVLSGYQDIQPDDFN